MSPARWYRGVLCGVFLAGLACSGQDAGEDPYAGTLRAEGPSGAYSFRYLSPPWAAVPVVKGVYAVLDWRIALTLDLAHLPNFDSLPVVLRVESVGGTAAAALEARVAALSPPISGSGARMVNTAAGIQGQEVSWTDSSTTPPTYWREGYFDGSALGGAAFRMQFRGTQPVAEDPLIEAMLASFASGTGNR